jgi:N-formylglutamate amidohydrolase
MVLFMSHNAYDLRLPAGPPGCVVFASPHSGREYPAHLLNESPLDTRAIRSSEDAFVDELIAGAPELGVPLLTARVPRAYVDLNRAPDEFDSMLIEGIDPGPANPRIAAGLGVIPRVVANGRAIYRLRLTRREAEARIDSVWTPYHSALARLLDAAHATHGQAILIDWHSMPHEALSGQTRGSAQTPDIVLGDRFGASAADWITDAVEHAFRDAGFRVVRNAPFAGVYISQTYGQPLQNRHVVQVELDRALYMHEGQILRAAGFGPLCARLGSVMARIAGLGAPRSAAPPLAAE